MTRATSLLQLATLLAMSLKGARSSVPKALIEAIGMVPRNVAMRPYSTAVAPLSSLQNFCRGLVTGVNPDERRPNKPSSRDQR